MRFNLGILGFPWRFLYGDMQLCGGAATLFSYPLANAGAWNAQGRIEWTPRGGARAYASVS